MAKEGTITPNRGEEKAGGRGTRQGTETCRARRMSPAEFWGGGKGENEGNEKASGQSGEQTETWAKHMGERRRRRERKDGHDSETWGRGRGDECTHTTLTPPHRNVGKAHGGTMKRKGTKRRQ